MRNRESTADFIDCPKHGVSKKRRESYCFLLQKVGSESTNNGNNNASSLRLFYALWVEVRSERRRVDK